MAEAAVSQFTEEPISFSGADMSTKLKRFVVGVGSIGDSKGNADDVLSCVFKMIEKQFIKGYTFRLMVRK